MIEMGCFVANKYEVFIYFLILIQSVNGKSEKFVRTKRALLFPESSTLGIFIAIAVPLELPNRNVFMSYNFEANYNLPFEGAHFIPGPLQRFTEFEEEGRASVKKLDTEKDAQHYRKRRSQSLLTRKHAYKILEEKFKAVGYNGKYCLLRLICEVNSVQFGENNGFLGDIFQVILTPTTSKNEGIDNDYFTAEYNGKTGSCKRYIKTCPHSLLNSISVPATSVS